MPIYTVQAPDGKTYDIEGPEGATPEQLGGVISANNAPKPYDASTFTKRAMSLGRKHRLQPGSDCASRFLDGQSCRNRFHRTAS